MNHLLQHSHQNHPAFQPEQSSPRDPVPVFANPLEAHKLSREPTRWQSISRFLHPVSIAEPGSKVSPPQNSQSEPPPSPQPAGTTQLPGQTFPPSRNARR